ncbi:MAG: type III polyketide synthase, partial [Alphaproteobacteria bacterium]
MKIETGLTGALSRRLLAPERGEDVRLAGLATALPAHRVAQAQVKAFAARMFGAQSRDFAMLKSAFDNAGILYRHAVRPLDWYEQPLGWQVRGTAFADAAKALLAQAAAQALADAGLAAAQIDTVVTVSSTGIATPTLDAQLIGDLGFRADIRRVPVFGLGCAGGVTGLSLAARLALAEPGSHVLMLCVETCTLAFRADRNTRADIIATILFGDGAAAACLSAGPGPGPRIGTGQEITWPDTLAIMGWDVDDSGFGVVFDRSIPDFVRGEFAAAVDAGL